MLTTAWLWLMRVQPEWLAMVVNSTIFLRYLFAWREPGKILYWGGAVLLTVGLLKLKG